MNGYLLDTNVVSEFVRPEPDANVLDWLSSVEESTVYLSVLTVGEIRRGIERLTPGRRRNHLEGWLTAELMRRFDGRLLPVDVKVADRWGVLVAALAAKGTPVPAIDGLLAATALHHDLTFVTRNLSDVSSTGVRTLNPWL